MIEKILGLLELRIERKGIISFAPSFLSLFSLCNSICKVLLLSYAILY